MDNEKEEVWNGFGSIKISMPEKELVDLKIRLKYEQIGDKAFLKLLIQKFMESDDRILGVLDDWRESMNKKKINRYIKRLRSDRKKVEKDFNLKGSEIKSIYDSFTEGTEIENNFNSNEESNE